MGMGTENGFRCAGFGGFRRFGVRVASQALVQNFEKLDVFRVAVALRPLVDAMRPRNFRLKDQLDRAATSIACNIAQGAGRSEPRDKRRFYSIARGSANECIAVLALLLASNSISPEQHAAAYDLLQRIIMMLNKLVARFD